MSTPLDTSSLFNEAMTAYQSGDITRAQSLLENILEQEPQNDMIISSLGGIMLSQQRMAEAEQYFKQSLEINPDNIDATANLGILYNQQGKLNDGLILLKRAADNAPDRIDIQFNYASFLMHLQQFPQATPILESILEKKADFVPALNALGSIYAVLQQKDKAIPIFHRILELSPNHYPTMLALGNLLVDTGQFAEAENLYLKVIEQSPDSHEAYALLGKFYTDLGTNKKAKEALEKAIALRPNDVNSYILLGNLSNSLADFKSAEGYYKKALQIDPNHQGVLQNIRRLNNRLIPRWHFDMLADEARNDAYQQAIEKAVKSSDLVLDIGTGSGLLSMMAARAGAKGVVACEMHEKLAEVAQRIVKQNGYEETIQVHHKKSTELSIGKELPEGADLIVSEILDCGGLGEGVLPSIRHATNQLSKPNVRLIPSRIKIFGQLIEIPERSKVAPVGMISGFDLSAFEEFRIPNEYIRINLESEKFQILSDVVAMEEIDFYDLPPAYQDDQPLIKTLDFSVEADGELQAIVFWFDLNLDDDICVSTKLGGELMHWGQALFCFEKPRQVKKGEHLKVQFRRSDMMINFALL